MTTRPKFVAVRQVPPGARPTRAHGIGVATLEVGVRDDDVVEWVCLDASEARGLANNLLTYADELDDELVGVPPPAHCD